MVMRAQVSSIEGPRSRVTVDGRVSAPLSWLITPPYDLVPGDRVVVAFFGVGLCDGVILGREASS